MTPTFYRAYKEFNRISGVSLQDQVLLYTVLPANPSAGKERVSAGAALDRGVSSGSTGTSPAGPSDAYETSLSANAELRKRDLPVLADSQSLCKPTGNLWSDAHMRFHFPKQCGAAKETQFPRKRFSWFGLFALLGLAVFVMWFVCRAVEGF